MDCERQCRGSSALREMRATMARNVVNARHSSAVMTVGEPLKSRRSFLSAYVRGRELESGSTLPSWGETGCAWVASTAAICHDLHSCASEMSAAMRPNNRSKFNVALGIEAQGFCLIRQLACSARIPSAKSPTKARQVRMQNKGGCRGLPHQVPGGTGRVLELRRVRVGLIADKVCVGL